MVDAESVISVADFESKLYEIYSDENNNSSIKIQLDLITARLS